MTRSATLSHSSWVLYVSGTNYIAEEQVLIGLLASFWVL